MNQYLTGKYTYTYTSCKTTVHVPGTGTETPKTEMASKIPIGPGKSGQPWTNRNPRSRKFLIPGFEIFGKPGIFDKINPQGLYELVHL